MLEELGRALSRDGDQQASEAIVAHGVAGAAAPAEEQVLPPVTLLRGADMSLDNAARFVRETMIAKNFTVWQATDDIFEKLDFNELSALLSQAKKHPQLEAHIKEMVGDDPDDCNASQLGSEAETALDELSGFVSWLAERSCGDGPAEPREAQHDDSPCGHDDDGSDSFELPEENQPWFFLRRFASVSLLQLHSG